MAERKPCPTEAAHTPCPRGYIAWHEWAERKGKTHRAVRCEGCGTFAIWVPLDSAPSADENTEGRDA